MRSLYTCDSCIMSVLITKCKSFISSTVFLIILINLVSHTWIVGNIVCMYMYIYIYVYMGNYTCSKILCLKIYVTKASYYSK